MTAPLDPAKAAARPGTVPPATPVTDKDSARQLTCTATMLHALLGARRCGEPAGHYDEAQAPGDRVVADEPGGWHRSAPDRDGRRLIWSDRFDAAKPHSPTTAP